MKIFVDSKNALTHTYTHTHTHTHTHTSALYATDHSKAVVLVLLFVCFARVEIFTFFSSYLCRGLAGARDYGTPWTFLLTFLIFV